jgi:anti-anti-sigma factor
VNSWAFGAVCSDPPAAGTPEQACSSQLHAVFTTPPPTLHLAGDIDEWTFPELTKILARTAAAGAPRIHIDLADVQYCDVAGLRAIISLASGQGDNPAAVGEIVFTGLPGPLRRVLRILGWDAAPGVVLDGSAADRSSWQAQPSR